MLLTIILGTVWFMTILGLAVLFARFIKAERRHQKQRSEAHRARMAEIDHVIDEAKKKSAEQPLSMERLLDRLQALEVEFGQVARNAEKALTTARSARSKVYREIEQMEEAEEGNLPPLPPITRLPGRSA